MLIYSTIIDDCPTLFSQPLRTKSAMPPNPPTITAEIIGMEERVQLEEALYHMVSRRDRLCREINLLRGMVVIKHLADRDEEISRLSQMVGKLDTRIKSALKEVRKYTGITYSFYQLINKSLLVECNFSEIISFKSNLVLHSFYGNNSLAPIINSQVIFKRFLL